MLAKDIMTSPVTTINETATVRQAVNLINETRIGALPVVDDSGRLTGIVTEGDLLRRIASSWMRHTVPHSRDREDALADYIKARSWRIHDVMSSPVVSATPTATIAQLAELLQAHNIKHLPVVERGLIEGIISRCDLMRTLVDSPVDCAAAGDDALVVAVRSRLETELEISPTMVTATVSDGKVTLCGVLESQRERDAARVAAESVRGVTVVVNNISVAYHMFSRPKP